MKDNENFNSGLGITIEMLKSQCKMTRVFQLGILDGHDGLTFFPKQTDSAILLPFQFDPPPFET